MTLDLTIPKLVLDPANEGDLIELSYERIREASGNTITDFRQGSAAAAFVEGQVFALAELLYYLNLMPEAIAIEVFRLYGVERALGNSATGELTFMLTETALDPFVLPAGYSLSYLDTELITTESLVIPVGSIEGTVAAKVQASGVKYNADPFGILAQNSGLSRVQSVFNRGYFTGGSDLEPLTSLVQRCQAATVSRNVVLTALDYELAAQTLLGVNSRAVAVANLSSDGYSYQQYSVGLFLLDSTGKPASATTCQQVNLELNSRIPLGSSLACFPAVLVPLTIEVQLNVKELSQTLADEVVSNIKQYLKPNSYDGGDVVLHNEIAYRARLVSGVRSVDSVLLNGQAIDYQLAQPWHYPTAGYINVEQVNREGLVLSTVASFEDVDYLIGDDRV